jgi:hypothetical protein
MASSHAWGRMFSFRDHGDFHSWWWALLSAMTVAHMEHKAELSIFAFAVWLVWHPALGNSKKQKKSSMTTSDIFRYLYFFLYPGHIRMNIPSWRIELGNNWLSKLAINSLKNRPFDLPPVLVTFFYTPPPPLPLKPLMLYSYTREGISSLARCWILVATR